jgi:hypothetical protein
LLCPQENRFLAIGFVSGNVIINSNLPRLSSFPKCESHLDLMIREELMMKSMHPRRLERWLALNLKNKKETDE